MSEFHGGACVCWDVRCVLGQAGFVGAVSWLVALCQALGDFQDPLIANVQSGDVKAGCLVHLGSICS